MASQTIMGKAFEYACLNSLYEYLTDNQHIEIEDTAALRVAKEFYDSSKRKVRDKMDSAADAAVRVILRLEPQLEHPQKNSPLILSIQEDAKGISGDVRDVLCIRRQNEWEIGLSCKHNHTAVKHSRLSSSIDFGQQWFGVPCSKKYFKTIDPLFDELRLLRSQNTLWRDVINKEERFYIPLLQAFIAELKRLDENNPGEIPSKLLRYLLGTNDFYKVMTDTRKEVTTLQTFNLFGTLNKSSGSVKSQTKIKQLIMPDRFFDISFKPSSQNTVIVSCDQGWGVSLRIHNASSRVEPSLKFDVKLIGVPPTLYTHHEPWK